jgi:hypothetical protein
LYPAFLFSSCSFVVLATAPSGLTLRLTRTGERYSATPATNEPRSPVSGAGDCSALLCEGPAAFLPAVGHRHAVTSGLRPAPPAPPGALARPLHAVLASATMSVQPRLCPANGDVCASFVCASLRMLMLMKDLVHNLPRPIDFEKREQVSVAVAVPVIKL